MRSFNALHCSLAMLCAVAALSPVAVRAITWTGGGGDALASNGNNWEGGVAPGADVTVLLDASSSSNMTWDLDVPVGSWTQDGYTGTVTIATRFGASGFTNFVITGNCLLNSGTWTHQDNSSAETYRLRVTVGGDMTVGAEARVSTTGRGYDVGYGPGTPTSAHGGAGHGGEGDLGTFVGSAPCYGSICSPVNLGSGSKGYSQCGGGAILITAAGALTVDGRIDADGTKYVGGKIQAYYGASGGSVWLTAASLAGTGSVSAVGSYVINNYFGAGGRIALVQTGPATDFSGFKGATRAVGSWNGTSQYGAAGTVYFETAADGRGGGILVVDGNGTGTGEACKTRILLDEQDAGFSPKSYVLKNNAYVEFSGSDAVFHPGDTLVTTNKTRIYIRSGTTIDLRGTTFMGGGTPDRQIRMYAGSAMRVDDDFTFNDITVYATDDDIAAAQYTNLTVTSSSVTLGSGAILIADFPVIFTGDLLIAAGGTARHSANSYDEKFKLNLAVRGDMTIEPGGGVNVDGLGYRLQNGPGAVSSPIYYGACHAGRGVYYSDGTILTAAACYGSIRRPSTMGSGGVNSQSGGGVIRLNVDGTLLNNGAISACGMIGGVYWSAAGGSIWITAGEIAGAGNIFANGTPDVIPASTTYELFGGGRVSVELTDAASDFGDYASVICARGNQRTGQQIYGGAGTVYLKTGAQASNGGTLIIDNFTSSSAATCGTTDIAPLVTDTDVGSVVVRNGGHLAIFAGQTLSVSGDWSVTNNAKFTSADDGVVSFTGNGVSRVTGDTTFGTLDCLAAGKELSFAAGGDFAIAADGMLRIDGGTGAPVVLSSQTNGVRWTLDVDATASVLVNNAEVSDSDASAGAAVLAANTTLDNCFNWSSADIAPGELITWTGAAGTSSFATPGNWSPSRTPVTTDRILVPGTAPVMPVLAFGLVCAELTVAEGALLGLGGYEATVHGPLTVAGTLTARSGETIAVHGNCSFTGGVLDTRGTSTLVLAGGAGPGAQVFTPGGLAFDTVTCSPGASGISIAGSFSAAYLSCSSASDTRLAFAAGATATVTCGLLLDGTTATPCITLASATAGLRWNLAVTGQADISGVIVNDSAATASTLFAADSTDGGSNSGWIFNTDPRVTWVGGGSGDFGQASNWSGNAVPGSDDAVLIADASVTASASVSARAMAFGHGAVFTANATVNVADAVVLTDNASVAFNRKTEIGGSLILDDDAVLTHSANNTTQANVLDVEVGGDLIIGPYAAVDTRAKGYVGSGPGRAGNCGGSHGGRGETHQAGANANRCYGSVYCPTNTGSAGAESSHSGGGSVRLAVAGTARVDGTINADGCPSGSYTYYSGSGGSVWLAAERLLGGGEISANGGDCYSDYVGGGGRVAVYLTAAGAKFAAFTGVVSAYSGLLTGNINRPRRGSCGTVYLETAADGAGRGKVILDNTATGIARGAPGQPRTDYPVAQYADPQDGRQAVWTLRNTVRLNLVGDARVADLVMEGSKPILDLNGYTLRVDACKHTLGENESVQVVPGDGGLILWAPATLLILR